jgi:phosphopantothenoylcysteine synthetase/decarboxylase
MRAVAGLTDDLELGIGLWIWRAVCTAKLRTAKAQTPSLRVPCMTIDEKCMAHARECVRLAGLTDDQEVRDQLIALARDWIVAARKHEEEEEEDDDSKVLVFPSAVERSHRHGLRMSLRHAGPRRLS